MKNRKLTRELGKNSTARSILEYAFFVPAFTRNDIITAVSWRVESAVADALDELRRRGYIEPLEGKGSSSKKFFRLSEDGRLYLARNSEYFMANKDLYRPVTYKTAVKDESWYKISAFVHGAGVRVLPTMKPSFARFVGFISPSQIRAETVEDEPLYASVTKEQITQLFPDGIFYNMREIRKGLEQLGQNSDEFLTTVCKGIVFTERDIYLIYHNDADAVVLAQYTEEQLLRKIRTVFIGKERWNRDPICICTGKTYLLGAAITIGYIRGKMAYEKKRDTEAKKKMKDMSASEREEFMVLERARIKKAKEIAAKKRAHAGKTKDGSKKIFFNAVDDVWYKEIYYVPVRKYCTATLSDILAGDAATIIDTGRTWFQNHKGFSYKGAHERVNGICHISRTDAVYLPVMDCKALSQLRDSIEPISVVTDPSLADTISHCLGRVAADFYDMDTGEKIPDVERYDEFGYPLSNTKAQLLEKARQKRMDNLKNREPVSRRLPKTIQQYECTQPLYEQLEKEYSVSQNKIAEEILYYVLADAERLAGFKAYLSDRLERYYDGNRIQNNPFLADAGAEQNGRRTDAE